MNIIRVRDKLKAFRDWGAISEKEMHRGLHAPLFLNTHDGRDVSDDELRWLRENVTEGGKVPKRLPYREFIIWQNAANTTIYAFQNEFGISTMYGYENLWVRCIYRYDSDLIQMTAFVDGKAVKAPPPDDESSTNMANLPKGRICQLCLNVMLPGATVLRVEPENKNGKSVQWRLARTHFLLVDRKQATKCMNENRGPTDDEITRAAHYRRAHFRQLVSERYSAEKRSKLIPVRQAWVGPKEWTGLDGKIYKVVE